MSQLRLKILVFLFCSLIPIGFVHAFHIEPYVGVKSSALTSRDQISGFVLDFDGPASGGLAGLRLGKNIFPSVSFGFEGTLGYLDHIDGALSTEDFGIFLEHQFRIPLRTWIAYFVSSEAKFSTDNRSRSQGTGAKFGIGYLAFSYLSVNIEYLSLTYDLTEEEGLSASDTNMGSILLSISLPTKI